MSIKFHLKDAFNLSAIGAFLKQEGNELMAESCKPARLAGASALGFILLAGGTFGLSAAFGFATLSAPAAFYGIGFAMEALGKVVGRIAPQTR